MIRHLKERIAVTMLATLLGTALGAIAGFFLSRNLILKVTEAGLVEQAGNTIQEADHSSREARIVLAEMNATPYAVCSDAEIAFLHNLVFQSEYLKEAGRIHDGRIACSSNLGKPGNPIPLQKPSFVQPDGITVYRDFAPLHMGNLTVVALQLGNSYVIISPYLETHRAIPPVHYSSTAIYNAAWQSNRELNAFPHVTRGILTVNGHGQAGDELYATQCSPHYYVCVTDYVAIANVLQLHHREMDGQIALSALAGAAFGLLFSLLYRHNRSMAQQLRRAIRDGQLRLVYQPIVRLQDRRIVAAEALARWTDEEGFEIPPNVFIKLAEERGFVGELTRLVVHKALVDLKGFLQDHPDFRLNINVTAGDLGSPVFLPMLKQALEKASVRAQSLAIEITESSTAQDQLSLETLLRAHQMGITIFVDDFGTGYSSLSYLHDLPVDCLKVDKSFTHAIGTESVTAAILPQILAMAQALQLDVVVEGIETEEQVAYFAERKEPLLMQGWLFGYPMPAGQLLPLLADDSCSLYASAGAGQEGE